MSDAVIHEDAEDAARECHSDWRLALMAGLLSVGSDLVIFALLALGALDRPIDVRLRLIHIVVVGVFLAWMWSRRRTAPQALSVAAFLAVLLPYVPIHHIEEHALAAAGRAGTAWSPFVGHRILMFCVAALCPRPRWLGAVLLAGLVLDATLLWFQLDLGAPHSGIPREEPALGAFYALIACMLYGYRLYHEECERRFAHVRAELASLRTVTDAFLAVKDLANTPLQNLELALAVMEQQEEKSTTLLRTARQAVRRLRELNQLLPVEGASTAVTDPGVLERLRQHLHRQRRAPGPLRTPP